MTVPHGDITSSDGTRIAVWRSGAGPALILVHGTTADHGRWARVSEGFAGRLAVYAMDRRGRGGSGDSESYSIEQEGEDVRAVARSISGPASLLGHSYGALCCLEAAPRIANLHKLILYEPPLPVGVEIVPPAVRETLDRLLEDGDREAAVLTFFREVVRLPEAQLELLRGHQTWPSRIAAAHTVVREVRLEATYRPDLERLGTMDAQTLLLLGGDSPAYFREAIHRLKAAIPNSRILEMPGQQHVAMDTIPDEFVAMVSSFLLS